MCANIDASMAQNSVAEASNETGATGERMFCQAAGARTPFAETVKWLRQQIMKMVQPFGVKYLSDIQGELYARTKSI